MSATSSSPLGSPPPFRAGRPQHNCLECKRLKRACDKGSPCGKCAKANRTCEYKDPSDDGVFGPIASAKDVHSLAFGTLLDILVNKARVREAVSSYFGGVNTWLTVIERAGFERELDETWDNFSAEASVLTLCMALIARPPNQKSSKGMGDTVYHSTKAILSLVQSKVPMSVQLLQAELLVATYEYSHSKPQQAYLSLGRCLQITKALGWHGPDFWSIEHQASMPKDLKLCSILWWAIVYIDCLLNVGYPEQMYPMHTMGIELMSVVPTPDAFDRYFLASLPFLRVAQYQGYRDVNGDQIEGIVFPEAGSALYLSKVLEQLSNPTLLGAIDPIALSGMIWQHARETAAVKWRAGDRNAAVGTDFIALMKLNQPGLFGGLDPMSLPDPSHTEAVQRIRNVANVVHGKASKLAESEDRLSSGGIGPCWAFAVSYASQLLIAHGDNVLQDASWFQKASNLRTALDRISKRWMIAERYCESIRIALDNRYTGFTASEGQ